MKACLSREAVALERIEPERGSTAAHLNRFAAENGSVGILIQRGEPSGRLKPMSETGMK